MVKTESVNGRILVIGPAWVGDMVMAHSLIQLIQAEQPGTTGIDVLAPAWALPLTDRMVEVSDGIVSPFRHGELNLRGRLQLAQQLRARNYQLCIVLPNSLKSALLPFAARIPRRTGFIGEQRYGLLNDIRKLDKEHLPLTVQRFCTLGLPAGATLPDLLPTPKLTVDRQQALQTQQQFGLSTNAPTLALCPGAEFGPSKQWPVEHYAELAIARARAGWDVWILGSGKDASIGGDILLKAQSAVGHDQQIANLCGLTNLGEAIDLLSLAQVAVSNDSGLMHVTCAVDTPVVALFGSTTPAMTPPLGARHVVLEQSLPCRPCFKRNCPLHHLHCLKKTSAQQADDAIDHLLAS